MSDYAENVGAVLKLIDRITEPTYKQKLRLQRESSKDLAKYTSDLKIEQNNLKYERELLNDQLSTIESDITGLEGEWETLNTSYNTATGEWLLQKDLYKTSTGLKNYDEIFNNTTNFKEIENALTAARTKRDALTSMNNNLSTRINTIGNYNAYQTKSLDYERYTDTGKYIVDPQDIEASYAESLLKMGYNPSGYPELFPSLDINNIFRLDQINGQEAQENQLGIGINYSVPSLGIVNTIIIEE